MKNKSRKKLNICKCSSRVKLKQSKWLDRVKLDINYQELRTFYSCQAYCTCFEWVLF